MSHDLVQAVVMALAIGLLIGWVSRGRWDAAQPEQPSEAPSSPAPRLRAEVDRPTHATPARVSRLATRRRSRA